MSRMRRAAIRRGSRVINVQWISTALLSADSSRSSLVQVSKYACMYKPKQNRNEDGGRRTARRSQAKQATSKSTQQAPGRAAARQRRLERGKKRKRKKLLSQPTPSASPTQAAATGVRGKGAAAPQHTQHSDSAKEDDK